MNNLSLATAIFTSPVTAFSELRERPRFLFPLILLAVGSAILVFWYYSIVDIKWLSDQLLSANERLANLPPEARERMAAAMSRNSMRISSVVSVLIAVPAAYALQAVYYLLAGKVAGVSQSFTRWFTMVAWSGLPALIGIAASAATLITENSPAQLGPNEMQVLSLNALFFHVPMSGRGASVLSSISLISPWSWVLMVICVRTWTNRSWMSSAVFALLPVLVWYAGWAVISFR